MRFLVMVKATRDSEAGLLPSEQLLAEMGRYNEELVKAGIMQAGEGLQPSSRGARVKFSARTARWSTGRSPGPRSSSPALSTPAPDHDNLVTPRHAPAL